jgi:hypothetical protein
MATNEIKLMAEVREKIIDYLQEEIRINSDALKAYEPNAIDDDKRDPETRRIREIEAIKLRDRIHELNRHIAVIKRMYPNA